MPARWFTCPDGGRIEIQQCLAEGGCRMSNRCATRSYLRLAAAEREWTGKPSCTQLIAGTMLSFLRLTTEYAINPDDRAFMIHGTKAHATVAGYDDECSLLEEKLDGEDTLVTGIFDVLEEENGKSTLVDYKTSGSYRVAKALGFYVDAEETGEFYKSGKRKGQPKTRKMLKRDESMIDVEDWQLQLNWYRMELEKRGFKVHEMRIMCVVRDGNTWIARSRGVFRNIYHFKIAKLPDHEVLAYFQRKRRALLNALEHGVWDEPCNGHENWDGIRCARYCEVAEFCPLGKYLKQEKEREDMPIKSLQGIRKIPEVGRIRLGVKKKNQKGVEYPSEVEYFIPDPTLGSEVENQRLKDIFHKLYGEKPTSIDIMFPSSDAEIVFPQWLMRWTASGLQCRGDEQTAVCRSKEAAQGLEIVQNEAEDGLIVVSCEGKDCHYYKSGKCRRVATLNVLLPKIPGIGVWRITTGSFHSIANLNSWLDWLRDATGRAHMLGRLKLQRKLKETTHEDKDGNTIKGKHYVLDLYVDASLQELQQMAQVDPDRIALSLPAVDKTQEEIYFQDTPDAIDSELPPEPESEEKAAPRAVTYADILRDLAGVLDVADATHLARYMVHNYGTHGQRILAAKAALEEDGPARNEIEKGVRALTDELVDAEARQDALENGNGEEPQTQPRLRPDQKGNIKLLAEQLYGERALGNKKFLEFRYKVLKNSKELRDLSQAEGDKLIEALNAKIDEQIEPTLC